ncbi:hypothetical protein [Sphingosinicella rhizophila]|uniref:Zinc-ribbon 15 domain-containing protein n=1 Tax=Sphingosinicella rhizophila TaxID=3050082 RepID=A0ABU3Q9B1_9SPHN|nr:hypothetical protein [Sphingosinicella sp. GR2756]MDT9599689.1 hypothetical protein [Sphingosinicella sp. GR2756]
MADTRIWTTRDFLKRRADARISCAQCHHAVILSPPLVQLLFPAPCPLDMAIRKLRCSRCGARQGRIAPVPPARR